MSVILEPRAPSGRLFEVLPRTLSGIVKVNGLPTKRRVLVYRNYDANLYAETWSDETNGSWSVTVEKVGEHDRYRIVCVGEAGENSEVYEHIQAIL